MKIIVSRISVAEKKYDPSQPRAPKGSPDGGQWTADGGAAGGGNIEFSASVLDEDIDRLDKFGATSGNVERFKQALAVQGYDATVKIGFDDGRWWNPWGDWSDGASLVVWAEYKKDGEKAGRFSFFVRQDEESDLYVFSEPESKETKNNPGFLDAVRDQEFSYQVKDALPGMGWVEKDDARWTLLSPTAMQDYYSEHERNLLTFPTGYIANHAQHYKIRKEVKDAGEAALEAAGVSNYDAYWIQNHWAETANDEGGWQDALHEEALKRSPAKNRLQETSGIQTLRLEREGGGDHLAGASPKVKPDQGTASIAFDSIQQRTQEFFRSKGLGPDDELVMYRGVKKDKTEWGDAKVRQKVQIHPRPLTSWSLSFDTAKTFATPGHNQVGLVYAVRMPVKYAFAHASTGFGCLNEEEIILLGDGLIGRELEITRVRK